MHFADELQDLAAAQIVVKNRAIGQVPHMTFDLRSVSMTVEASDSDMAAARHQNAHHHADRGRFAGTVGSEKAEHLAARHRQRQRCKRPKGAISLRQFREFNHARSLRISDSRSYSPSTCSEYT